MQDPSFSKRDGEGRRAGPVAWSFGRWVDLFMGLLFVAIACVVVWMPDAAPGVGRWIAAIFIGGLGVEALIAAGRNRQSLMSRIGPLP